MKRGKLKKEILKLEKAVKVSEEKMEKAAKTLEAKRKEVDKKLKKLNKAQERSTSEKATLARAKAALVDLENKTKVKNAKARKALLAQESKETTKINKRKSTRSSSNNSDDAAKITKTPPIATSERTDDLTIINGIGPKLAEILNEAGITSLAQLARRKPSGLRKILVSKGDLYRRHNPETWPSQAAQLKNT